MRLLGTQERKTLPPEKVLQMNLEVMNEAARMRAIHQHTRCPRHPDHSPVLVLHAKSDGGIQVDRSGLCCDELALQTQLGATG